MKPNIIVRAVAVLTGIAAVTWLWRKATHIDKGAIDTTGIEARLVDIAIHDHMGQQS